MLRLFVDNLLPVVLAAGVGYFAAARWELDPRPLAAIALRVFAPCLIFRLLVEHRIGGSDTLQMVGFAITVLLAGALLATLLSRAFGASRSLMAAVFLAVLMPNGGNYGLAVNLFAFGEEGLVQASVFFVVSSVMTFTLGVLVISAENASWKAALRGLLAVPIVWSIFAAFLVISMDWHLPLAVARPVELFAGAAIPSLLLVLGMQLRKSRGLVLGRSMAIVVSMRLLGGATIALLLAPLFGLDEVARQAGVVQAAMPCAVMTGVLATEYDVEPEFVTSAVLLTTLLSPLTLTIVLAVVGA